MMLASEDDRVSVGDLESEWPGGEDHNSPAPRQGGDRMPCFVNDAGDEPAAIPADHSEQEEALVPERGDVGHEGRRRDGEVKQIQRVPAEPPGPRLIAAQE